MSVAENTDSFELHSSDCGLLLYFLPTTGGVFRLDNIAGQKFAEECLHNDAPTPHKPPWSTDLDEKSEKR